MALTWVRNTRSAAQLPRFSVSYDRSVTEAVGVGESLDRVIHSQPGLTESIGTGESIAAVKVHTPRWAEMTTSGSPPSARWYMGAAYVPSLGGTVFYGGTTDGAHAVDGTVYFLSDVGAWSTLTTTSAPPKRWGGGFVFDGVDKLHLIGGYDSGGVFGSFFNYPSPGAHWVLDVNTLTWSDITSVAPAIDCGVFSSAVYGAAANQIAYWTGQGTTVATDTIWFVAPPSPTWTNHASGPSARNFASLAYDEVRGRFILCNGDDTGGGFPTDTWEVQDSGHAWSNRTGFLTGASLGGQGRSMCWSPDFGTLAFGGATSAVHQGTQFYDGSTWTTPTLATEPPARQIGSMVWDSVNGRFILFGGQGAGSVNLNDVWVYQ